ncbi:MAG TPA: sodium:solute symporter family protein [Chthonomonadales bacterium]|nr:sodium:solute symporter family protein [Chthonomonadales bacterium]
MPPVVGARRVSRLSLAPLDIALIGSYLIALMVVGFWRRRTSADDYLIASRSLSLPVFVATLVATWYGGILAIGEFTYGMGLLNWTTQALPYYLCAVAFALLLAPRIRQAALLTIPDKLERDYGRGAAVLGAVCAFILCSPAPYVLMIGHLVVMLTGWPLLPAIVAGTLASVLYVYAGGFRADVRINVLQFVLMFAGFGITVAICATQLGGYTWLVENLPPDHLRLDGGQDAAFVGVWFMIALWTFVDPGFHQRCYAARTPSIARNGVLIAVVCWATFDLLTTTTGLYARAAIPNLPPEQHGYAFPMLAEHVLPAGVRGVFIVAMLATVMSTVVSYTFLAALTIGRDALWRLSHHRDESRVTAYTRGGMVLAACWSVAIALLVPSAVRQWYMLATVVVPGLLLPVLSGYFPALRISPRMAATAIVAGSGTSTACLVSGWLTSPQGIYAVTADFPLGMQPMAPGLLASAGVFAAGLMSRVIAARRSGGRGMP